jgi:starch-binding outer membrane protein, SusD/RagB family
MMNYKKYLVLAVLFIGSITFNSCKKFLEKKSVQSLSTPETLEDLQLLLDNPEITNTLGVSYSGTDEFYMNWPQWRNRPIAKRLSYIWDPQVNNLADWNIPYNNVFYANTILLNLETVNTKGLEEKAKTIQGSALFIRAYSFYHLAQFYAPQYDPSTASNDLGIVLRLNADFNVGSVRSTVQVTYDQIITDLNEALNLLPSTTLHRTRPNKAACYALLAKTYLQMGKYSEAKSNADACLQLYSTLLDYNSLLPVTSFFPFPFNNPEIIYYSKTEAPLNLDYSRAKVDSNLFASFNNNDIRRQAYFIINGDGTYAFRGNYTGEDFVLFNGLATDEVYLIRAESNARLDKKDAALEDLNLLLSKRWVGGTFVPLTTSNSNETLRIILSERKKQLINRGTRWADLRRLNKDPQFQVNLKRVLNGQTYELPPNDLRYTLLIPREIINLTNLPQNPR